MNAGANEKMLVGFSPFVAGDTGSIPAAAPSTKTMSTNDITQAYCKANGLKVIKGKLGEDDPAPILAFLIMDCAYQEFCGAIKKLPLNGRNKQLRGRWLDSYRDFNRRLFSTLNDEERDYAVDLMDAYQMAVPNEIMMMRVAIMDLVASCEFADQKTIASLLLCNIFSQVAQIVWGCVFVNERARAAICPELLQMRNISHTLANSLVVINDRINPNASPKLNNAVSAYMDKTSNWLNNYSKK